MLNLKSCAVGADGAVTAKYDATHVKEGKDGGTLTVPVHLVTSEAGAKAFIEVGDLTAAGDEESSFDILADILERAAAAIRARGTPKLGVPVYG